MMPVQDIRVGVDKPMPALLAGMSFLHWCSEPAIRKALGELPQR